MFDARLVRSLNLGRSSHFVGATGRPSVFRFSSSGYEVAQIRHHSIQRWTKLGIVDGGKSVSEQLHSQMVRTVRFREQFRAIWTHSPSERLTPLEKKEGIACLSAKNEGPKTDYLCQIWLLGEIWGEDLSPSEESVGGRVLLGWTPSDLLPLIQL